MDSHIFRSTHSPPSDYTYFELSELLEWVEEDNTNIISGYPMSLVYSTNEAGNTIETRQAPNGRGSGRERGKKDGKARVAFKTLSNIDILEDGFKWRKYGKKMVKKSPNPRNYYRCSVEGCMVKKRVERDREDPRYVITTYDSVHNHHGPSTF